MHDPARVPRYARILAGILGTCFVVVGAFIAAEALRAWLRDATWGIDHMLLGPGGILLGTVFMYSAVTGNDYRPQDDH